MQRPTLQDVRVRSTRDALQVFHAVAQHTLPLIVRRLDAEERRGIVPGNIYVWEERSQNNEATGLGMERWTDGLTWGPSRVRDSTDVQDPLAPVTPWAQMIRKHQQKSRAANLYPTSPTSGKSDTDRLIKQTYSVHVSLPADHRKGITRKWHLTAYFSQEKLDSLKTIDSIPGVGDVPVPDGWFQSARASKRRDSRSFPSAFQSQPQFEDEANYIKDRSVPLYSHYREPYATRSTPSPDSASSTPSPAPEQNAAKLGTDGQLVPLAYLQNVSYPRRNPADEQFLRMFSSHTVSSPTVKIRY